MSDALNALFQPRSVAIIGASDNPAKLGHTILKNIIDSGFQGAVYPINPKAVEILNLPCFKNITDVPDTIDMVVVVVPASAVPQVIKECGEKRVKAAVIISGGFAEAGPQGEKLQKEIVEIAKQNDVRILGPNCQGINLPYHPLCASWPLLTTRGRVAVISQSGTVGAAMMDWFSQENLGVSAFISLGNRCDVDETDLVSYFNNDEKTSVIALYIEGLKNPQAFTQALENLQKPVVLLKSGRTPKGIKAAESHTRSLAGDDALYNALCRKYKIYRADTIEEFYDLAKAFAYLPLPQGNRIFFVTTSGGAGILATDQAEREGLDVAPLPEDLAAELRPLIPAHAICSNPLDLTGDATATMFGEVIRRVRTFYDIVGVIFGDPVQGASEVVTPSSNELVIFLGGADVEQVEKQKMHKLGIPVFPTPERGVHAIAQLIPPSQKGKKEQPSLMPKIDTIPENTELLTPSQALEFLKNAGFPCLHFHHAESAGKAVHTAHLMGFPVAVKLDSSLVAHKTDVGGVILNIQSANGVRRAFEQIRERFSRVFPSIAFPGVVIMPMAEPGQEFIMGVHRTQDFGTVLLFGLGGLYVELFQDVSIRLLPVTDRDIEDMINETKASAFFRGVRNREPLDKSAIMRGLKALAKLMDEHPEIVTIDINPLIVYSEGYAIVDARIIKKKQ
ncbi:MAG: acetate--CoA ligase family protein [Syntrophobacterales bacterium]|nr:acetate--CoA ligase family protein [Syntrophobacterales bacterium]